MNNFTYVATPMGTHVPIEMQVGSLILFFFGCVTIVSILSCCLFGQRALRGCKWFFNVCSLRCCLKCCCPRCCKKTYKRLVERAKRFIEEGSDDDISDEEEPLEYRNFIKEINDV